MENPGYEYLIVLNQGGLTIPSPNLVNYVCDAFAFLSTTDNVLINLSKLTSTNAAKEDLSYMVGCCTSLVKSKKSTAKKLL